MTGWRSGFEYDIYHRSNSCSRAKYRYRMMIGMIEDDGYQNGNRICEVTSKALSEDTQSVYPIKGKGVPRTHPWTVLSCPLAALSLSFLRCQPI